MSKRTADLKDLSIVELQKRLVEAEENLAHLRFQLATSQLESPIAVRTVRRSVARLKTMIRIRILAARPITESVKES